MANCNSLFEEYNDKISLTKAKNDDMTKSKDGLRNKIKKHFAENHSSYKPKFYIQGSYKMKTGIRTKDDICDLDDGVYFFRKPDVSATTLQLWVKDAVNGYTSTDPEHRRKCIRTIFTGDYEIDHPIYYKIDDEEYQLAVKNIGWEESDPKGVVDWFNSKKDNEGRIIKIVKYLKAWGDNLRNKMPSGLAMSILAVNAMENIVLNDRNDILLTDVLREMKKTLDYDFKCIVPAVPYDNLFAEYDESRKNNFKFKLRTFLDDAEVALKERNQFQASKLWQKHLGDRFPDGEDVNSSVSSSAAAIGAARSNPWTF